MRQDPGAANEHLQRELERERERGGGGRRRRERERERDGGGDDDQITINQSLTASARWLRQDLGARNQLVY